MNMHPRPSCWSALGAAVLAICLTLATPLAAAECTAGPPLVGAPELTPVADFAILPAGLAVHLKTRLVWKRCAEGQTWNGNSCNGNAELLSWSAALARSASTGEGGSTEWRVPNRKELESIVELCGHSPAINQTVFPGTPGERFWTSTTFQAEPNRAWDVYFSDGYSGASPKSNSQHIRLVRALTAEELPLAQTITFGAAPAALGTGGMGRVTVSSSSGLPVTLTSATPSLCSLSGSTVTALSPGTCILDASQPGDAIFAAAPGATLTINITGTTPQTINFGAVPVLTVGATATISATASSGLPVIMSAITPGICSLNGNSVHGIAVGTCTITANQNGNQVFAPAAQARQDIVVGASAAPGGGGDTPPPPATMTINLLPGWNLIGNGSNAAFVVENLFGQHALVASVWKWVAKGKRPGIRYPAWAFRTPALADQGQATANSRGYEWLDTVEPGEAFWVHARSAFSVTLPGAPLPAGAFTPIGVPALPAGGALALERGWSLITTGEDLSPAQFHAAVGGSASNLVSIWAWDSSAGKWLFYAPELDSRGGTVLADYANRRGYRDFQQYGKRLLPGMGFWVHRQ